MSIKIEEEMKFDFEGARKRRFSVQYYCDMCLFKWLIIFAF